jgi:GNAT superfamily N-acetyltransferase
MSGASEGPGPAIAVRPIARDDAAAFLHFAGHVPDGERRFLKEDLSDPAAAFTGFLGDSSARRLVAVEEDGGIAGLAGAFPGEGWSSHVAEVRVLVSAARRGQGVGRVLARAALMEALDLGCSQVYVEVVAEQEALVTMFQDLGFAPEALLADFVRDGHGEFHDLMLLTHRALDHWGRQQLLGLDEVNA